MSYIQKASGGSLVWGEITGNIEDQTDLVEYLNYNLDGGRADSVYTPMQFVDAGGA